MKLRMAFREKAKADVIRKKLEAEYGFSSLSASVDDLVAGILKRGRIGSNKEADQVREFLSEEGNSREVFEESDFIVLERYLVAWEKR